MLIAINMELKFKTLFDFYFFPKQYVISGACTRRIKIIINNMQDVLINRNLTTVL